MKRLSFTIPLVLVLLAAGCGSDSGNLVNSVDPVDSVSETSTDTDKNRKELDVSFTAGQLPIDLVSDGNIVILSETGIMIPEATLPQLSAASVQPR